VKPKARLDGEGGYVTEGSLLFLLVFAVLVIIFAGLIGHLYWIWLLLIVVVLAFLLL
jgi:hypothetical protein